MFEWPEAAARIAGLLQAFLLHFNILRLLLPLYIRDLLFQIIRYLRELDRRFRYHFSYLGV